MTTSCNDPQRSYNYYQETFCNFKVRPRHKKQCFLQFATQRGCKTPYDRCYVCYTTSFELLCNESPRVARNTDSYRCFASCYCNTLYCVTCNAMLSLSCKKTIPPVSVPSIIKSTSSVYYYFVINYLVLFTSTI